MNRNGLVPLLLVAACSGGGVRRDDDSGADSTTIDAAGTVNDLSARLHDAIGSVVYVSWQQIVASDTVSVAYRFEGETWLETPAKPGQLGPHEAIVLGIPYATPLQWRVVVRDGAVADDVDGPAITTGAQPSALPTIALGVVDEGSWDPAGRFLLTSVSAEQPMQSNTPSFWVTLIDRQGRYVWAIPANERSWTLYAKPSRDGTTLLYDDDLFWTSFDPNADSVVHQIRLDGSEVRRWEVSGMAHAFDDLSEDTIAWNRTEGDDDVVVVSEGSAAPVPIWSCRDWLTTVDLADTSGNPSDAHCGSNALSYNEDRGTYTVSLWSHETVLEFDAASGAVLWFADPGGGNGYTVPTEGVWHWQHEAQLLSADRLLLSSGFNPDSRGSFAGTASYEYLIDHATGSLTLVWSYVSEPEFAAQFKGGVCRLPGGNTLAYYGSAGGVKEITPAGDVPWQIQFDENYDVWSGRSYFLDDLYAFVP